MANIIYCKKCEAPIRMIKMKSGKFMPVDSEPVSINIDPKSHASYVTLDGGVIRGVRQTGFPNGDEVAVFVSHFATCPAATAFRRTGAER